MAGHCTTPLHHAVRVRVPALAKAAAMSDDISKGMQNAFGRLVAGDDESTCGAARRARSLTMR